MRPFSILWHKKVKSTNVTLREGIDIFDNLTVIASEEQVSGRGQGDHSWHSASGENLTCSILLKEVPLKPSEASLVSSATALAVTMSKLSRRKV